MRGASLLLLMAFGAECQRTPPEDFAPRATTATTPTAASDAPAATPSLAATLYGRCVQATPAQPPAPAPPGPDPSCPPDPENGGPQLPVVHATIAEVGAAVDAEVVQSEHDTMRGLMYRRSMAEERGMLFHLRARDDQKFWMHNTCISLDLLYVDDDGLIVGIVENAPTMNDETRGVGCPSRWVLEVNAGWSRRHGVKAGQRLVIPRVP
jgi:uncharacterized membrane protein (UPF0127 family)